jgi:peptidoglycan/LPS O-acetylase OafA/YrhL
MKVPETNNFTALRLLLALLVVFGHFMTLPGLAPATGIFAYAHFAVSCFFVVSGYLIFASFDKRPAIGDFYIRRLFRIYPLYLAVVVVQALIMAVLAGGIVENSSELLRYLGLNLMMANFLAHDIGGLLDGLHNPGINPSLWTLKIEFAFYLLLPLLWVLTRRFGLWFLLLLYVASAAYVAITLHYGMDTLAKQLPGQMRFFVVGMALSRYHDRLKFPTWAGIIVAGALFLLCNSYYESPFIIPLYPLLAGLIMFIFVFRLPLIPLPFDISYGVYLLHGPLIQFSLLLGIFMDTTGFLLLLLASVLLLALAAERLIEQPGIELGKRLARSWVTRLQRQRLV